MFAASAEARRTGELRRLKGDGVERESPGTGHDGPGAARHRSVLEGRT